mmetsp:Transcript_60154/g.196481  ORF Transcript_60154/g.196481 Transcript_60154/m.196481 type:complete len:753 (-) Transcript_60154:111-2369(-)
MPSLCQPGGPGAMWLPLFGEDEQRWPNGLRGVLYAMWLAFCGDALTPFGDLMLQHEVGLIYCFVGVAIIADLFMAAIEKVTSRRKKEQRGDGRMQTLNVWNETVATLTLMALGSSAPEIFLSIVDIFKNKFKFGQLGPATIVGSASFNLLVIVSVCIATIPSDEVRMIRNVPAFAITAISSLLAYVWMAITLVGNTAGVVDLWEALVTFLLFPVLVYVSYKVDRGDLNPLLRRFGMVAKETDAAEQSQFLAFSVESLAIGGVDTGKDFEVTVLRRGPKIDGAGPVSCTYRTEGVTAVPGFDYEEVEGSVEFEEGQTEARIQLRILDSVRKLNRIEFLLILEEAEGDVCFDPEDDGGDESAILTVAIEAGEQAGVLLRNFDAWIGINSLRRCLAEWKDQIVNSFYCNGSLEEQRGASAFDWITHIIALPWKVAIAFCPPVCLGGGWICFFATLAGIGIVTVFVSDLAELFGCVVGIPDFVTAITIVALGTSMPDLFASLSAAKEDPSADASIVNVTGSNSVNVYLGLGVPWTMAALYWEAKGSRFYVQSENLAFSVGAFCYVCLLALGILWLRRTMLKAELGGSWFAKVSSSVSFIIFWLCWVFVVSWQVLRGHKANPTETALALGGTLLTTVFWAVIPMLAMRYRFRLDRISSGPKAQDDETSFDPGSQGPQADTGGTGNADHFEIDVKEGHRGAGSWGGEAQSKGASSTSDFEPDAGWDTVDFTVDDVGDEKVIELPEVSECKLASAGLRQ